MNRFLRIIALAAAVYMLAATVAPVSVVHAGEQAKEPGRIFTCVVSPSTATTAQAMTGACGPPAQDQAIYVTDINFTASANSGTSAGQQPTIETGTGSACGTGTVIEWLAQDLANQPVIDNHSTPLQIPAGQGLCWLDSTAATKTIVITGYIGSGM